MRIVARIGPPAPAPGHLLSPVPDPLATAMDAGVKESRYSQPMTTERPGRRPAPDLGIQTVTVVGVKENKFDRPRQPGAQAAAAVAARVMAAGVSESNVYLP